MVGENRPPEATRRFSMFNALTVASPWVCVREGCSMQHKVLGDDEVEFSFEAGGRIFEFVFTADALRKFLEVGRGVLREMREIESREGVQSIS
jgi:hypothetical protein